jgi:protein-tyrosine phosphatase
MAEILRAFVEALLAGNTPALIHCAAGKDRTGFGCAILLIALGSPWPVIERDYLQSNKHVDLARIRFIVKGNTGRSLPWQTAAAMTCRLEYLHAAIQAAADVRGSIDGYLEEDLGLTSPRRLDLQRLLLENPT